MKKKKLSEGGREQVALALILLKDFKCDGRFDVDQTLAVLQLAEHLGVAKEYYKLMPQIPPMKIVERYPGNG